MVYEGGWGNEGAVIPPPQIQSIPQHVPSQPIPPPLPVQQPPSNLPYKVNQIRLHFGIKSFSPILTDEEDGDNGDLASDLLNSLGDFKMNTQQQQISREKAPIQQQPPPPQTQQQQYQGYYGYGYQPQPQSQPQPQRTMAPDNRWMDYRNMGQGMTQPPQQVYNPLNPMAGKYSAPPQPQPQMGQMGGQMYKNPMVEQRRPQMGQYYRPPPPGDGYDRRYQGGYQQ